jgi:hypothetical protein
MMSETQRSVYPALAVLDLRMLVMSKELELVRRKFWLWAETSPRLALRDSLEY